MAALVKETRSFALKVVDFSSQYGSEKSATYTVSNLGGEHYIYPNYGDFTQACVLRTYGPWWKLAPSGRDDFKRTPSSFISDDFAELSIQPCFITKLEIYETYHPGAIVKILACDKAKDNPRWFTLWECSQDDLKRLPHEVRIFKPTLRKCPFPSKLIRLEFNSRHLDYYTELDAVKITGIPCDSDANGGRTQPKDVSSAGELLSQMTLSPSSDNGINHFEMLPQEVIQLILSYLDLRSLCRMSRTCHLLHKHCCDAHQYTELNLQPYWDKANNSTLEVLSGKCYQLSRLNLSWCGKYGLIDNETFQVLLVSCGRQLTTLRLACCPFVDDEVIQTIVMGCPKLVELDLQCCRKVGDVGFLKIMMLQKLQYLNLYRTYIDLVSVVAIIRSCKELQHLNIGACPSIFNFDDVATELGRHCPMLKSLDVWRGNTLTEIGLLALANGCGDLEELELGWCGLRRVNSGDMFLNVFSRCPKLKKVFVTANKVFDDKDLMHAADYLPDLEQLDILGCPDVTPDGVLRVLEKCKKLKFFDVSFCAKLDHASVIEWRKMYPLVDIKKSFQTYTT